MIFRLALTNLNRNRLRTAFTVLGVIIVVAAYFGVSYYFTYMASRMPAVEAPLPADIIVTLTTDQATARDYFGDETEVAYYEPLWVGQTNTVLGVRDCFGVVPDSEFLPFGDLTGGRKPSAATEVALPESLAEAEGIHVGDQFALANQLGSTTITRQFTVVGIFRPENWRYEAPVMLSADARAMTHGRVRYMLRVTAGLDIDLYADRLGGRAEVEVVETPKRLARIETDEAWEETWGEAQASTQMLLMIILLIAGLGVFNTMTVSALQRQRELGILKAMGINDDHVLVMFLTEGAVIAAIAIVAAAVVYLGALHALRSRGLVTIVAFAPGALINASLQALAVSLIPAWLPAWRVSFRTAYDLLTAR